MIKFRITIYNFMDDVVKEFDKECHNLCSAAIVAGGSLAMDFDDEQKESIKKITIKEIIE